MPKPLPSGVNADGIAPAPKPPELEGSSGPPKKRWLFGTSRRAVTIQSGLEIVPPLPFPVANERVNTSDPKFVSESWWQKPVWPHAEGASAIH